MTNVFVYLFALLLALVLVLIVLFRLIAKEKAEQATDARRRDRAHRKDGQEPH